MDERRLHDHLESLERAAPAVSPPALRARRTRSLPWLAAGLALVAGLLIGLWGAQLLPREPAHRDVAINPVSSAAIGAGCPVTRPPDPPFVPSQGPARPPDYERAYWYGTDALWTMPTFDGTWTLASEDGWYGQKTFWWSEDFAETVPAITVTGRRLDGSAGRIHTDSPTNASSDFGTAMLVGIDLPTPGCWELTATYRGRSLSYVVYVHDARLEPPVADLRWTEVAFDRSAEIRFLSVVGHRAFATGRDRGGAAAWYSDDGGTTWSRSRTEVPPTASIASSDLTLGRVVSFRNRLVSLGTMATGAPGSDADVIGAVWLSDDNGATWQLSAGDSPPVIGDLAARDDLLVAVGRPPGADAAQIWTSADVVHWQRASVQALEHVVLAGVAATADRFLVVGTRQNGGTTTSAMTWESSDGITWQATAVTTPGRFNDIVAGPPALVIAGDIPNGGGAYAPAVTLVAQSFTLNDIRTSFGGSTTAVASGPGGIVVSAQVLPDKLQGKSWFLPNGSSSAAAETASQFGGFDDLVAVGDGFIGVSHCPPAADCSASSTLAIGRPVSVPVANATASPACGYTAITRPPDKQDDPRLWMRAGDGLWAIVSAQVMDSSERGIKILWVSDVTRGRLTVDVASVGSPAYRKIYHFDGDTVPSGFYPSGFVMPPPGCYRFSAEVGGASGQIVLEVADQRIR